MSSGKLSQLLTTEPPFRFVINRHTVVGQPLAAPSGASVVDYDSSQQQNRALQGRTGHISRCPAMLQPVVPVQIENFEYSGPFSGHSYKNSNIQDHFLVTHIKIRILRDALVAAKHHTFTKACSNETKRRKSCAGRHEQQRGEEVVRPDMKPECRVTEVQDTWEHNVYM